MHRRAQIFPNNGKMEGGRNFRLPRVGKLNGCRLSLLAGECGDGAVVGGFTFFGEEVTGNLIGFAVIGNVCAAVAALVAGIGAGAHLRILLFL